MLGCQRRADASGETKLLPSVSIKYASIRLALFSARPVTAPKDVSKESFDVRKERNK